MSDIRPITFLHCHVTIYTDGDGGGYFEPALIDPQPAAPADQAPQQPQPDTTDDYKRGYNDALLDSINQAKRGLS